MKDTTDDVVKQAAIQLTQQLHARLRAIEKFTGYTYPNVRGDLQKRAIALVSSLHERGGDDDVMLEERARDVCRLMFGEGQHPPVEFWATKLGTDVAWAIGYPVAEGITPTIGSAVLRCSRQSLWKITDRGTVPLTPQFLRERIRQSERWQLLSPVTA